MCGGSVSRGGRFGFIGLSVPSAITANNRTSAHPRDRVVLINRWAGAARLKIAIENDNEYDNCRQPRTVNARDLRTCDRQWRESAATETVVIVGTIRRQLLMATGQELTACERPCVRLLNQFVVFYCPIRRGKTRVFFAYGISIAVHSGIAYAGSRPAPSGHVKHWKKNHFLLLRKYITIRAFQSKLLTYVKRTIWQIKKKTTTTFIYEYTNKFH